PQENRRGDGARPHHLSGDRACSRGPSLGERPSGRRGYLLLHIAPRSIDNARRAAPRPCRGIVASGFAVTTEAPLVLVSEDEPQTCRFLRTMLKNHGFRSSEATTEAQGLRDASTRRPALILLDLNLPDIDEVEIARRLREWCSAPIIVLSVRD